MEVLQKFSIEIMGLHGIKPSRELLKSVRPWDLEAFALFSVMSKNEFQNKSFKDRNYKVFFEIIKTMWNHLHPKIALDENPINFVNNIIMISGLTQFPIQEPHLYKLFRFNYIFTFKNDQINMQEEFRNKFGCDYAEFMQMAYFIILMVATNVIDKNILDYFFKKKYAVLFNQLIISREEFIKKQNLITKNIDDYTYCFKLFCQYPFIEEDGLIYFPLPHLLIQACTSSLRYRLTENNDELHSKIGKEVLENYILHILQETNQYDEAIGERKYNHRGIERRTIDVMIRKGNSVLLIDSKSTCPFVKSRIFDEESKNITINRISESIVQVYKHLTEQFNIEYNYFNKEVELTRTNIYGMVVIFEDTFIPRETFFLEAAKKLNIKIEGPEYEYLCSNIKVFNLYELETKVFNGENLIELLKDNKNQKTKWFDFTLFMNEKNERLSHKLIEEFIENLTKEINNVTSHLVEIGLMSKK